MKKILIVPVSIAVAACATPTTEPVPSETSQATAAVATSASAPTTHATQPDQASQDQTLVAENRPTENPESIQALEAPQVNEVQPGQIPGRGVPESTVVCEKVYPTGSVLPTKVCRDVTDIERKQEADRKIFDDIKRNTAIGNTRL